MSDEIFIVKPEPAGKKIILTGVKDNSVTELVIPKFYDGKKVAGVSREICKELTQLKILIIELDNIQYLSLENCKKLQRLQIGKVKINLRELDMSADIKPVVRDLGVFSHDYNDQEFGTIGIAEGYSSICSCSYFENTDLEEVIFPSTLKKIGERAFWECTSLKEIILPDSVTDIETDAFNGCRAVTKLKLPKNLSFIRRGVFAGIDAKEIVIPDSVISISDYIEQEDDDEGEGFNMGSFEGCGVEKLTLSKNLELIGNEAFSYCTHLKEVIIPNSVKEIGNNAFKSCCSMTKLIIPESVKTIGEIAFAGCESLTEVIIPDSIESIEKGTFRNCKSLKKVILPKNLKMIDDEAFFGCTELKEIIIPKSVEKIGKCAFDNCPSLDHSDYNNRFLFIETDQLSQTNPFKALQILYFTAMNDNNPAINKICTMLRTNDKIMNPNWPLNDEKFLTKVAQLYKNGDTSPYEDVLYMYREHPKTKNPEREQEFLKKYINQE